MRQQVKVPTLLVCEVKPATSTNDIGFNPDRVTLHRWFLAINISFMACLSNPMSRSPACCLDNSRLKKGRLRSGLMRLYLPTTANAQMILAKRPCLGWVKDCISFSAQVLLGIGSSLPVRLQVIESGSAGGVRASLG